RKSIPVPAGPNVCSTIPGRWTPVPEGRNVFPDRAHEIDRTLHEVPRHNIASLRDATPSRTRFLQTLRPYRTLGLRSSVGDPSVSPQTVFNPKIEIPRATSDNRRSIPVPAGPNVCSTI